MKIWVKGIPTWMELTKMGLASFMVNTWNIHQEGIHLFQVYHLNAEWCPSSLFCSSLPLLTSYFTFPGSEKRTLSQGLARDSYYSTYHTTPERRKFTKEEYEAFTREETKKGMQELLSSPDFNRWALANADRISVTPAGGGYNKSSQQRHRFLGLFWSLYNISLFRVICFWLPICRLISLPVFAPDIFIVFSNPMKTW
jgi:hypothetical protein